MSHRAEFGGGSSSQEITPGSVILPADLSHPANTHMGEPVAGHKVKIFRFTEVPIDTPPFGIDDQLRMVVEFYCSAIRYVRDSDERNASYGQLLRESTLKPQKVQMAAWSDDPDDNGVLRASIF